MGEHCNCCDHDHCEEHDLNELRENFGMDEDAISLVDEDGVEHRFEIADVLDNEGTYYMALIPLFETAEDLLEDSGELAVLKVVADGAQEYLEAIDNEEEFNKISKMFMERLSDEYDFEE